MRDETQRAQAGATIAVPELAIGEHVNIGRAAELAGISPKRVRYYESLGLLPSIARTEAGYRLYGAGDVHALRFIRRARDLGFEMAEIALLLSLWHDRARASRDVKRIAQAHIDDLTQRIDAMTALRRTLEHLADCCHGDARPMCPILDDLATGRGE